MVVLVRITQELVLNILQLLVLGELLIGEEADVVVLLIADLRLAKLMALVEVLPIVPISAKEELEKMVSYTWSSTPNDKESTYFK